MRKLALIAVLSPVACAIVAPLSAHAASPDFCRFYADTAVNQVRAALSNPACAGGATGARWTPEHRIHFDWCLGVPVPQAEAERAARTGYLRNCRG